MPRRALFACVLALSAAVQAEPYTPSAANDVLQRLPAAQAVKGLAPLRATAAAKPRDLASVLPLARAYLQVGRTQGDPRFVSYALTTLAPWLTADTLDTEVLVLAATAQQYLHRFDVALALLDRALAARPLDAQALLTRATLLEVQGRLAEARQGCATLARATPTIVAITCLTSVASRSGDLDASRRNLAAAYAASPGLPPDIDSWVLRVLADMAERAGEPVDADRWLARAHEVAPGDAAVKAALADRMLREGRAAEVIALLRGLEDQDALLLRLALAARQRPDLAAGRTWAADFRARTQAAQGDRRHLREAARFLLDVGNDAQGALTAARANWQVQREPEDLRLLLRAAAAAQSRDGASDAQAWMREHRYEDRTL